MLRKIEELRIPVDCIAGTSMGALVGGLYASGMSVDEMEELVLSTDWKRLFDDTLERPERSYRRKQDDRDNLATVGVGITKGGIKLSPGVLQGERILAMFERATLRVSAIDDFDELADSLSRRSHRPQHRRSRRAGPWQPGDGDARQHVVARHIPAG